MIKKLALAVMLITATPLVHAQRPTKTTENNPHPNIDYKQPGTPMPELRLMAYQDTAGHDNDSKKKKHGRKRRRKERLSISDSTGTYEMMSSDELKNNAPLFVMLFNPTCSHCEEMTSRIEKNKDIFGKSQLVMVATPIMKPYIPDFAARHHVPFMPGMYIGFDSSGFIDKSFLYQMLPQINVYGADRKLLKIYSGEVPIDTLKKYIN